MCKEADINFADDRPAAARQAPRRSRINAQVTNHRQKCET
jgi:hypothetical protein